MISIIVAVSEDLGIGRDNELLWHLPEDLRRFKRLTLGNAVIMGKKTWESLPRRPLPGRKNIVLTDDPLECIDCAITAYSIDDALHKCEEGEKIFVIGGGSVYKQFITIADRLYITHVHEKTRADIYFPEIDLNDWKVVDEEVFAGNEDNEISYTYVIYDRNK